jgi:cephalosporin-C deacetylase-like acetyl esterase
MTAAIEPRITAAMALVPAGCDMLGPEVGRDGGWPKWYTNTAGKDPAKVHQASRYYDIVNFASRINCPVLVGTGLIDQTCPPAGVVAAFNQIHSPKKIMILPHSEHQDHGGSQAPFRHERDDVWLPALLNGQTPPVTP